MKILGRLSFLLLISFSFLLVSVSAQTDCANQDYECKIALNTKKVQANPNDAEAYFELGFAQHRLGRVQPAIESLTKYIQLKPERNDYLSDGYNERGTAYLDSNSPDLALADFNSAISANPASASAYINRGLVYYRRKNYPDAMADFTKAIQIDPTNPESFYNRGLIYMDKAQYTEAITDFDKYISMNTSNQEYLADGYFDRGRSYFLKGNEELALKDINTAIETAPKGRFYKARAAIYRKQGKTSLAVEDEQKATSLPN